MPILEKVLEQYGLTAAVFMASIYGLTRAIMELWKKQSILQGQLHRIARETEDREAAKRAAMRDAHERELAEVWAAARAEAKHYAERLDSLHEKRNLEMKEILRESIEHIAETRASVDKITETMQVLRDLIRRQ